MRVLVCLDVEPAVDGTCTSEAWVDQPTLLPPLSVEEGLLLSGAMITVMCTAWSLLFVRRYLWAKA